MEEFNANASEESPSKKTIFLDFDGVLWHHDFRDAQPHRNMIDNDPVAMERVARLAEVATADVVISSSWRHWRDLDEMKAILTRSGATDNLVDRVVDLTPVILAEGVRRRRGREIGAWLSHHKEVDCYVILDDFGKEDFLKYQHRHLVQTTIEHGFTEKEYEKAIRIIEKPRRV
jgi:hypothetical protein